jgi:hypothetical protein
LEKKQLFNQHVVWVYNTKNPMIHLINGRTDYLITPDPKRLSRAEKSCYEKVSYHLRLKPAIIISNNQSTENNFDDLIIRKNRLQFANCLISKTAANQIDLAIYRKGEMPEAEKRTISFGNMEFGKETESEVFRPKLQGAFYTDLNSR